MLLLVVIGLLGVLLTRKPYEGLSLLAARFDMVDKELERSERSMREELSRSREETANQSQGMREELNARIQAFNDSVVKQMNDGAGLQNAKLHDLIKSNEERFEKLRDRVEQKLTQIQQDNAQRLEEMRKTVDEKLQGTLEKRLGESFKLVGDRLEEVHKGLGEMQSLASGVGDLKKMLSNVKVRGNWGEMQLGALLEQILAPDQYARNVKTREHSDSLVEFAVRLPGKDDGRDVWLPIDSKFPREDYERVIDASERGDVTAIEEAGKAIERQVKAGAKDISEKYINPPITTDFAIMFIPIEGLYAEILRRPGLMEFLQTRHRVNISGPTTLAALLNSLQMGFRTLAIQKRSSEVWKILAAVKAEFDRFGGVIDKVQKKLLEASAAIESDVAVRTRAINRSLRTVQQAPGAASPILLEAASSEDAEETTEDIS